MRVSCKFIIFWLLFIISFPLFSQEMYLELNLNEKRINNPLAVSRQPFEIFNVINKAANDSKVRGIVLNIGSVSAGRDYFWELRTALEQFKESGKKICAYISFADTDTYLLASVADKIIMDELGILTVLGYSMGRGYVRQTLEKLGIGVRELNYFEYKSAVETFTRDSMSEADKRQYNDYLDDIFNLTRETLMNARNWTTEEFDTILNHEFFYSAKNAHERGLVDYIGRREAALKAISDMEGEEISQIVLYGNSDSSLMRSSISYAAPRAGGLFSRPPVVAIVYADGQTDMETGMETAKLSRQIIELADNKRVKAIVIRINSPGGSAEAADNIDEAVRYAKLKKPVVVSMGSMAASGGYWAAMNASHIVANPYTITGSIGVIGSWFYDNGLSSRLGFNIDILKRGEHSDLYSGFLFPYRNLTEHEESRYKTYIKDIYDIFVTKVAAGRGMKIEKVEEAAQGRIFSGIRALDAGLTDSVGGLYDAIRIARNMAGIPDDAKVQYRSYPEPKFIDRLMQSMLTIRSFFWGSSRDVINTDIQYLLKNNGRVMPILPLDLHISKL
ncbi:MAG: signal peptide peptidase SppA [Treponema sp.]|nr:signal peptide peptidase SppA [Treponema sp.]